MLAGLATAYVAAINTGAVPTIATAWQVRIVFWMKRSRCARLNTAEHSRALRGTPPESMTLHVTTYCQVTPYMRMHNRPCSPQPILSRAALLPHAARASLMRSAAARQLQQRRPIGTSLT